MHWLAEQMIAASARHRERTDPQRFNPRPAGVIREGATTQAVLRFLESAPRAWHTHHQIMVGTGRTTKAVCHALLYLRALGRIEATNDDGRNARYLRYAAVSRITKEPRP